MATIEFVAPQFLVDDLPASIAYYEQELGFRTEFVYEGFYAALSRGGATLHLKCAPKTLADRRHRREGGHLDAYFDVKGVEELHAEFRERNGQRVSDLAERPWGNRDFTVEDPDGYRLCFSESVTP